MSPLVKYETKRIVPQIAKIVASPQGQQLVRKAIKNAPAIAKATGKVIKWSYDQLVNFFGSKPKKAPGSGSGLGGYVAAPVATGVNVKGMSYSFHTAPDIGLGPGLRLIVTHRLPAMGTGAVDGTNGSGFYNGSTFHPLLAFDPSLATVTGDSLSGAAIPCIFYQNTGLQNLSKMFERFLFRHCTVEFIPTQATAFAGAWAAGYYRDCSRIDAQVSLTTATNYNLALSVPNGHGGPNWELQTVNLLHVPDNTPVSMADAFYVHTEDSTSAGTSAGRLEVQGAVALGFVGTTANTPIIFAPMAHTVVDLYCPAVDITGIQLNQSVERKAMQKYIGSKGMEKWLRILLKEREEQGDEGDKKHKSLSLQSEDSDDTVVIDRTGLGMNASRPQGTPLNTPVKQASRSTVVTSDPRR